MLLGETFAVYCENHTEHTNLYKLISYLTGNILRLRHLFLLEAESTPGPQCGWKV
jgi:hypothetical protein